jgi:hypothetical protein
MGSSADRVTHYERWSLGVCTYSLCVFPFPFFFFFVFGGVEIDKWGFCFFLVIAILVGQAGLFGLENRAESGVLFWYGDFQLLRLIKTL